MTAAATRNRLFEEYREIVLRYLETPTEAELYKMSLLSRKFISEDFGPTELIQAHFKSLVEILALRHESQHKQLVETLSSLLLEAMMSYSASHQRVRDVLSELEGKYKELDKTKRELEASRDKLKEQTSQLLQTAKMTALGQLAAGVAHEINQPLNAVKLICQDVLRDIKLDRFDPDALQGNLDDVVAEVRTISEIVDHMRVFTRRTAGTNWRKIDINVSIERVFKLIGRQLEAGGVEIVKETRSGLHVMGDAVRLEQVCMNLVTNARDAVDRNAAGIGKKITVRTRLAQMGDHEQPMVVLEVSDNGCGIPGDQREKVFESFFTTKEVGLGTGLGLSLSKQIIQEHGGSIDVASEEAIGTTFRVWLPMATEDI